MTKIIGCWGVLGTLACSGHAVPSTTPSAPPTADVIVSEVAPGVYAAIRTTPLGLAVNSNSLFIVSDTGVLVVDAQFTRQATLENVAAIRRITRRPVKVVVNTHWHDDHVAGNQVYRDSFPGVRFLAHAATRRDIAALGRPNRRDQVRYAPPAIDRFERLLGMGLGGDSTAVHPAERASLTSAIRIMRRYVAEDSGFVEVLPDSVTPGTRLQFGRTAVDLLWFGRGNTPGDLVVWLPNERVLASGDLVVHPMPFGFNSYPTEWIGVLDSVIARQPRFLVPGHGPVMTNTDYVRQVRRMLATARDETLKAYQGGVAAESLVAKVRLETLRQELAGDDKWMRTLFASFFRGPVVGRLAGEVARPPAR